MEVNGAKRCPVCKKEPKQEVIPPWYHAGVTIKEAVALRCHGYVAQGDTLEKATQHWNKFIGHQILVTTTNSVLDPGSNLTSPCIYCQKPTTGKTILEPSRYYVQCDECHLVKFEKQAQV